MLFTKHVTNRYWKVLQVPVIWLLLSIQKVCTDNNDIQIAFHNFFCRDSMSASSTRSICSSQSSYCNYFVPCHISEGCRTVDGLQICYTNLPSQLTDEIASEDMLPFSEVPVWAENFVLVDISGPRHLLLNLTQLNPVCTA